jgi:hypothetical protein
MGLSDDNGWGSRRASAGAGGVFVQRMAFLAGLFYLVCSPALTGASEEVEAFRAGGDRSEGRGWESSSHCVFVGIEEIDEDTVAVHGLVRCFRIAKYRVERASFHESVGRRVRSLKEQLVSAFPPSAWEMTKAEVRGMSDGWGFAGSKGSLREGSVKGEVEGVCPGGAHASLACLRGYNSMMSIIEDYYNETAPVEFAGDDFHPERKGRRFRSGEFVVELCRKKAADSSSSAKPLATPIMSPGSPPSAPTPLDDSVKEP